MILSKLIEELQGMVDEFGDADVEVEDIYGEMFTLNETAIANGPFLIIEEVIDKTASVLDTPLPRLQPSFRQERRL